MNIQKTEDFPVIKGLETLEKYNRLVNLKPQKKVIKRDNFGKFDYLTIGYIKKMLTMRFYAWRWEIKEYKVIANSISVRGTLHLLHPVFKSWMQHDGIAAWPIELQKNSDPNEAEKINKMAIRKNLPTASSEALKNAAKNIGDAFGGSLNGGFDYQITDFPEDTKEIMQL